MKESSCSRHFKAYQNLFSSYEERRKTLEISWKGYLSQIAENSSAGYWVKEEAKYLRENGET
jgi:hypothetical protein